jgi:hypothetical protein
LSVFKHLLSWQAAYLGLASYYAVDLKYIQVVAARIYDPGQHQQRVPLPECFGRENGRVCPMVGAGCITASQSACESIAAQSGVSSGDQFFTKL